MKTNKILEKLGLNKKQALIYSAVLEISRGSGQTIAEKAELPKSTTYDILKSLTRRGLISVYLKGKKRYFTANNPSIFKDKIKEQNEILTKFLPILESLYITRDRKPGVRFYEGKKGIDIVIKEILKEARNMISFGSVDDIFAKLPDYFPKFSQERAKRKIPIRIILRSSSLAIERQKSGPKELRQVKIIKTQITFHSLVWLWNNKIALITLKENLSATIIESHELTNSLKALFEIAWNCHCQDANEV